MTKSLDARELVRYANSGIFSIPLRKNWFERTWHDPIAAAVLAVNAKQRAWRMNSGAVTSLVLFVLMAPIAIFTSAWDFLGDYAGNLFLGMSFGAGFTAFALFLARLPWSREELDAEKQSVDFIHKLNALRNWFRLGYGSMCECSQDELRKLADHALIEAAGRVLKAQEFHHRHPSADGLGECTALGNEFKNKFQVFEALGLTKGDWGGYYRRAGEGETAVAPD